MSAKRLAEMLTDADQAALRSLLDKHGIALHAVEADVADLLEGAEGRRAETAAAEAAEQKRMTVAAAEQLGVSESELLDRAERLSAAELRDLNETADAATWPSRLVGLIREHESNAGAAPTGTRPTPSRPAPTAHAQPGSPEERQALLDRRAEAFERFQQLRPHDPAYERAARELDALYEATESVGAPAPSEPASSAPSPESQS